MWSRRWGCTYTYNTRTICNTRTRGGVTRTILIIGWLNGCGRREERMSTKKNGYVRLSTLDPDEPPFQSKNVTKPPNLKPGLFVMFSKDGRIGKKHVSDSEDIEMSEIKPRKSKHKRLKSPKSPSSKRPRQEFVEEPVQLGDTIQRVALRYSCPVCYKSMAISGMETSSHERHCPINLMNFLHPK